MVLCNLLKRIAIYSSGFTFGAIPFYNHYQCKAQKHEISAERSNLNPGFTSLLFYKLWNLDFHELRRPEVLIEISIIGLPLIIGLFTYYRTSTAWNNRYFYNTINITLNTVTRYDRNLYCLYFRTLMEKQVNDIIPNNKGIKLLIKAAKKTTVDNPFIKINDPYTAHTISNYFVNQISSLSSDAFLHRDILSAPNVVSEPYLMALICEPAGGAFGHIYRPGMNSKIRIFLIKKYVVEQLLEENDEYENEEWLRKLFPDGIFNYRWKVIGQIVSLYKDQLEESNFGEIAFGKPLCEVELSTRISSAERSLYQKQLNPIMQDWGEYALNFRGHPKKEFPEHINFSTMKKYQ